MKYENENCGCIIDSILCVVDIFIYTRMYEYLPRTDIMLGSSGQRLIE